MPRQCLQSKDDHSDNKGLDRLRQRGSWPDVPMTGSVDAQSGPAVSFQGLADRFLSTVLLKTGTHYRLSLQSHSQTLDKKPFRVKIASGWGIARDLVYLKEYDLG